MDVSYGKEKKDFREGGVLFLSVRLCRVTITPGGAHFDSLSDFLWEWQTDVLCACEKILLPQLRQAYINDPSPRKQFTHRPCIVTCSVSHEERTKRRHGACLLFTRRVDMTVGGETRMLLHERDCVECVYGFFLS